eukprot:TRINITY_DN3802_c4_g1_i1.p1 TRINITY_DN3802_c4_g1~~TRINITY_DN3802_c4_g1_i1.p1  ORF type:complete len:488 (+),score=171.36 TRINITY_DN3802_c4_g1_i1:104-1567(+)
MGSPEPRGEGKAADYRKVRTLGKGSYGTANLCARIEDGLLLVIKAINLGALTVKDRTHAEKEVQILQTLDHPNIIRYYDSFTEQSVLCIVTEYADGGDLGQRIKDHRARAELIPEEHILCWTIQLVLALKYLHDQKILHRDLKPANIFLTSQNTVKLGDFGVSTVLQASVHFAETFCGTPYYLSPEVCEEKPYNNKADMWALGCCLYELMALRRPFEGKNILQLADKICKAAYQPLPDAYSQDLRQFVEILLQRLPVVRPNVQRLLKLPLMQRNLRLLSDDLLDAEKYQRVLGTANLARARAGTGEPGSRRMTATEREAAEKAMLEWLATDRERLAADERRGAEARNDYLRRPDSRSGLRLTGYACSDTPTRARGGSGPSPSPGTPASASASVGGGTSGGGAAPELRDQVRDLLARREEEWQPRPGREAGHGRLQERGGEDFRAMQCKIESALGKESTPTDDAAGDFTDQHCIFAELLRSRSDMPPD